MAEIDDINTDLLINEVEKRPAIWNMTAHEHRNKILRKRAWEEVVKMFSDDNDSQEKKKNMKTLLQTKWRSLKDNFVRAVKKQECASENLRNSYIHFDRLLFLMSNLIKHEKDPETMDQSTNPSNNVPRASTSQRRGFKVKIRKSDDKFIQILHKSKRAKKDHDTKLFCLSLVSEMMKIPECRLMKAKMGIYNTIAQYQFQSLCSTPSISESVNPYSANQPISGDTTSLSQCGAKKPSLKTPEVIAEAMSQDNLSEIPRDISPPSPNNKTMEISPDNLPGSPEAIVIPETPKVTAEAMSQDNLSEIQQDISLPSPKDKTMEISPDNLPGSSQVIVIPETPEVIAEAMSQDNLSEIPQDTSPSSPKNKAIEIPPDNLPGSPQVIVTSELQK